MSTVPNPPHDPNENHAIGCRDHPPARPDAGASPDRGPLGLKALAYRLATWHHQASTHHRVIRDLVYGAAVIDDPGNGTIILRVTANAWRAAQYQAAEAPPEPLDMPRAAPADHPGTDSPARPGNHPFRTD